MPDADLWTRADALFDEVLQRPPDERTAWLRATCGSDPEVYARVERLLAQEAEAEVALGESATDFAEHLLDSVGREAEVGFAPGTRVGPYAIVEEIGRGGMGAVYRAERADGAFEKTVALKLVKRGMDTDAVLRRFHAERQILAGLDHPGIARLLDAGEADDGRPFLVMELVEGAPITAYADARGLEVEARVALVEEAAEAVAYAHRHLVVHRDLKPGNILVASGEAREGARGIGKGGEARVSAPEASSASVSVSPLSPSHIPLPSRAARVKLLDFGIARLLTPEAGATRGPRFLTPEYAAPEQARGEATTTATDVYALGAILYELLTGQRPGAEPLAPSAVAPPERRRALRGDLDTLCLAALHPDPERRYRSADALLDDLRRRRQRLPLAARPDSWGYRARRFAARHRWGVGVATGLLLLVASGVIALAVVQRETARERDAAEEVAAFMADVFAAADPYSDVRLDTLRAPDLLARGAERARHDLADQPALQARLLHLIGTTYLRLDRLDDARPLLNDALRTRQRLFGADHEAVAETRQSLGTLALHEGRYDDAEAHLTAAVETFRQRLGPEHETTRSALRSLVALYDDTARYTEAEAVLSQMLPSVRRAGDDAELGRTLHSLGMIVRSQERFAEAEPLFREALAIQAGGLDPEHPDNLATQSELGGVLRELGRTDEAVRLHREVVEGWRQAVGDEHRETEIARTQLAETLLASGAHEASIELYRAVLGRTVERVGGDHPGAGIIGALLAGAYHEAGQWEAAESGYREALRAMGVGLPPDHVRVARASAGLGATLTARGRYPEAEAALLEAQRIYDAGDHAEPRAARGLADLYSAWGRPADARLWRERADALEASGG